MQTDNDAIFKWFQLFLYNEFILVNDYVYCDVTWEISTDAK